MAHSSRQSDIIPDPDWNRLIPELIKEKDTIMLLGATDSGKSTFVRYAAQAILDKGLKVSIVDSDIGQSCFGLPGTISLKFLERLGDWKDLPDRLFFVGVLNPTKRIPMLLKGIRKMIGLARQLNSDLVLVDTTGLVSGEIGRNLKAAEIRAICPGKIIAIQKEFELERILVSIKAAKTYCLGVSPFVKKRSRKQRIRYRESRLADYFKGAGTICIPYDGVEFYYNDEITGFSECMIKEGILIGMNHCEDVLELGIIKAILDGSFLTKTPLRNPAAVNRIEIGDILVKMND